MTGSIDRADRVWGRRAVLSIRINTITLSTLSIISILSILLDGSIISKLSLLRRGGNSTPLIGGAMNTDETDENLKLGRCCACPTEDGTVRNIFMLDKRSPELGIGCWGCFQCGLPTAGAVAVLCDRCLEAEKEPVTACLGAPGDNRRFPISDLPAEPFEHDMSKHPDVTPVTPVTAMTMVYEAPAA
jgi:hypothetical protein